MTLTAKQEAWDKTKAEHRGRKHRPVRVMFTAPRGISGPCPDCPHRWKGHKKSGRCKNGCPCPNGRLRRPGRSR